MSWDISVQDLPPGAKSIDDIPDNFKPSPLGARSDVIARIRETLPEIDFADPTWGMLNRPGFSIEFNMGASEVCDGFMLHVRGGGAAVATIGRVLDHLKLRGIDCQSGEFFAPDAAATSFNEWQSFRDQVISSEKPGET